MSRATRSPRRLLMTADTMGGVWTYALELARGLSERGLDVAIATMGAPLRDAQRQRAGRIPRLTVFESAFALEWMEDPWHDVARAGDWLLSLEDRFAPEVVHLNGYAHAALPWRAAKLVVGHSCVPSWWEAVHGEPAPAVWDRYRTVVAAGLRAADLVVAPTAAMLAALRRHYGPLPRSRVVPNGRDARLFPPGAKDPMLFAAGRLWDEAKNVAALERVAARLSWPVYVAGETRHPGAGEAPSDQAGEEHAPAQHGGRRGTRALGRLSQRAVAAWLARSAIYALPARYEPFGLSVLEAALAGCALVLGDIPSLREVWDGRALFTAPDDDDALVAVVEGLIADPERRRGLAAAARARALELSPEAMVDGYLAAYAELPQAEVHEPRHRVAV